MAKFQSMTWHDRQRILKLLQELDYTAKRGGVFLLLVSDLGAELFNWIPLADLSRYHTLVAFTGIDGERYYATRRGLWRFGKCTEDVDPKSWWLAVLNTRAHFLTLSRMGIC